MAKPRVGILPYKMIEKASKDLPWDAAFSLVYLWTCPHRRVGGLFRLPLGYMASDLSISASEAKEKIELLEGKGYIAYEGGVVYLRGYMQAQNKLQGKVSNDTAKGIASDIAEIEPPRQLLSLWESEARSIPALWESLVKQGYVPLSEGEGGCGSESGGVPTEHMPSTRSVPTEHIPSACPVPTEHMPSAHQVRAEYVPTACQAGSEYIPSTYSVGTQYIPGYVPSGIGSGIGIGSGTGSESENINIKDLRISDEIREDFPSSTCPDSEKDILLEATEHDSTDSAGSAGFIDLETVSSSKRKTAVDGNDRNRKSSDNDAKATGTEGKNLEDCEKDHEHICASDANADSDGGASECDAFEPESSRTDDNVYCFDGSRESVGSGSAEASTCACDGRRTNRAQEDASADAPGNASLDAPEDAPAGVPGDFSGAVYAVSGAVSEGVSGLDDVGGHERTVARPCAAPVNCPHREIVALYHEILPELRQVRTWNATREKRLRARWREDRRRQSLSWWRSYFERVRSSSFLVGKKTDWSADFDWLVRPTNMAKVLEGKYDDSPSHESAPSNESAPQKQKTKTNVETLFRELVSSWPADRIGDMQAAKKTFCSFFADIGIVGIEEGNRRLKNLEAWVLVVLEREPKYVPRLDRWLAGVDVSIPPPESKPAQYEWVPVEDGELEAVGVE